MQEHTMIQEIHQYFEKAQLATIRDDENTERDSLQKAFELFEKLPRKTRTNLEIELYTPIRNMGRFLFTANQYEDSIKYIDRALSHPHCQSELDDNKINMKLLKCHSNLMLFLEKQSIQYLDKATDLLHNIRKEIHTVKNPSLLQDFYVKQEIHSAILQNQIWTIIDLELPSPIIVSETPFSFLYNEIKVELMIEIVNSPFALFEPNGGGFLEIVEDKYGLANRSKVRLLINKYLHPDIRVKLDTLSESNQVSLVVSECIKILNFFIERFRVTTDQYWIETISHKMFSKHSILIKAGNQEIKNVVFTDSTSVFQFSPSIPWITEEIKSTLIENLNENELPLWKTLLLDSKDYLLRGKNREAIVSVNSAVENFLLTETKVHLAKGMSEEEIIAFLKGEPNYNNFFLKEFINEETFNIAVQNGVITNHPPSTFGIIKKCNDISPLSISKRQQLKLISKIRCKRNDIVHGKENLGISSKEVKQSIESFEELVNIFIG
ncbi:hypothetical protein ACQKOM_21955 [Peribacillus frigoritolerans]|uniref:hypothetical protein n=1 Tax=Peribacillus frigoritolerans TaxID=450367 RepID=UPI003CFE856D